MNSPPLPRRGDLPLRKRNPWEVQRAVWFALLLREMKARVGGQWVGAIWTLVEPLTHVLLIVTMLAVIRGRVVAGVEYPVYLVTGLVPYFLFQHLGVRLMDGIESNRGLFAYRQVKPLDTLISRATIEVIMNLLVYTFTLGLLGWSGFGVLPAKPLELLGVNALLIVLGTGFGIFAAVVCHKRPRLRSFVRMAMFPLYFASGVIIPLNLLPREVLDWLLLNPLAHLIDLSRNAFLPAHEVLQGVNLMYPSMFALGLLALALLAYRADRLRLITSS